ncbi:MAG: hypothetical protein CFH41_02592 [Alphaproteobacteria bacterium MarineAlpha11_Bin1]|nr:MAG: hypothetical protein CFH41_02592 [Alphaproteobacteria bacterium MarineAlpha11_Bin1]|tara:strand:- start:14364 stop:15692 length:1329 start_codon:yes stop_codon:yes gene_type:complete
MAQELIEDRIGRAIAAQEARDDAAAEIAYREVLEEIPTHTLARNNLAALLARRGNTAEALEVLDALIVEEPGYTPAYFNRGNVLLALGRTLDAVEMFRVVIDLDPDNIGAHRALGFQWLAVGHRGRSLDHFARTYDLRRGESRTGIAEKSLRTASAEKLKHDSDLFRNLPLRSRDGQRFETLARLYDQVAASLDDGVVELTDEQLEILGTDYNTLIHSVEAPEILSGAVSPSLDAEIIEASWINNTNGIVTIDDLLTDDALRLLRRFLQQSTIWHDFTHIGGFVATYLEDGLACPLVIQIADEIRTALPQLLGQYPLTQAWAFKALNGDSPIDLHADDAVISLNFWITPDSANRNPETGGLVVYNSLPPPEWPIVDYDADRSRIQRFLAQNGDNKINVPYRENRGVIFDSRLFHGTDRPEFSHGYESHRINVTMLFGINSLM